MKGWLSGKKGASYSLPHIALAQAVGVVAYITLIANIVINIEHWFGRVQNFMAPLLFLTLFSTSALICGLLVLGYPILLIWDKKRPKDAVRLIGYTAGWLVVFLLLFFGTLSLGR